MAGELPDLSQRIDVDASGVGRGLDDAGRAADGFGTKIGGLGRTAGLAFAGIGLAAIGAGKVLFDIGNTFDGMGDTIRVTTGATGDALEGLTDSAKNVFGSIPVSADDAAEAIGGLNQRLGTTGQPLEDLASQLLELTRLTGGDLPSNINTATRLFGDWGISADDQAAALDGVFRATQETGVGFDRLSGLATSFGGPMRQLGFSFEETIALLGKFESEGVNTELVMGSMRQSLGRMAKAGEEPVETFARVTQAIEDAGSVGEANALSMELFGAKAGPDMAAAIREGRFATEDLVAVIAGGEDTIMKAAADTNDFGEQWNVVKNRVLIGLEPLATQVFNGVGDAMTRLTPIIENAVEWISVNLPVAFQWMRDNVLPIAQQVFGWLVDNIPIAFAFIRDEVVPIVQTAIGHVVEAFETIIPIVGQVIDYIVTSFPAIRDTILDVWANIQPGIDSFIATLQDIQVWGQFLIDWFVANWPMIQAEFDKMWAAVVPILTGLQDLFNDWMAALEAIFNRVLPIIMALWNQWGDDLFKKISDTFQFMATVVQAAIDVIRGILQVVTGLISGDWGKAWDGIQLIVDGVLKVITGIIDFFISEVQFAWQIFTDTLSAVWGVVWGAIQALLEGALSLIVGTITGTVGLIYDAGLALFNGLRDGIMYVWDNVIRPFFVDMPVAVAGFFAGAIGWLLQQGKDILQGLWDGINEKWDQYVVFLDNIQATVEGFFSGAAFWLIGAGQGIIDGLWSGIKYIWDDLIVPFFTGMFLVVKGWVSGSIDWLVQAGRDIVQGLWDGVTEIWDRMTGWISDAANKLPDFIKKPLGIGSPSTVFHQIGKDIMAGWQNGMSEGEGAMLQVVNTATGKVVTIARDGSQQVMDVFTTMKQQLAMGIYDMEASAAAALARTEAQIAAGRILIGGVWFDSPPAGLPVAPPPLFNDISDVLTGPGTWHPQPAPPPGGGTDPTFYYPTPTPSAGSEFANGVYIQTANFTSGTDINALMAAADASVALARLG